MKKDSRILITGGSGLVGTALTGLLRGKGYEAVVANSSRDLNLLAFDEVVRAFRDNYKPEYVFHLAGAVYGIGGNLRDPGRIFLNNVRINTSVVEAARLAGVTKIVAMGSICAYPFPPRSDGPLKEEDVYFGEPHPGERAYGQAKRALLAQLEAYRAPYGLDFAFVLSTNLYGRNDRFNLENGHVIPSLVRKFYEASVSGSHVEVWGDGSSKRDIMYSEDAAEGLLAIMESISGRVNLATGRMISIQDVATILGKLSGVDDRVRFNNSMPKGHEFAGIDVEKLFSTGFRPHVTLEQGLKRTFEWYAEHNSDARR